MIVYSTLNRVAKVMGYSRTMQVFYDALYETRCLCMNICFKTELTVFLSNLFANLFLIN